MGNDVVEICEIEPPPQKKKNLSLYKLARVKDDDFIIIITDTKGFLE